MRVGNQPAAAALPQPPVCQPRGTEMGPSRARQRARYSPASSCSGEGCNVSMNFVLVNLYRKRDRPDPWRSCSQPGELIWKGGSKHTGVSESRGRDEPPTAHRPHLFLTFPAAGNVDCWRLTAEPLAWRGLLPKRTALPEFSASSQRQLHYQRIT